MKWEIVKEKTDSLFLELKDTEGWYSVRADFSGCIHFNRYHSAKMGVFCLGHPCTLLPS
jgi:hypothetical protein